VAQHDPHEPAPSEDRFLRLLADVEQERHALVAHPIYERIDSLPALRVFMRSHVFAVWDFMTLVKRLQADLTWVGTDPWLPPWDDVVCRLINDIVLAEESDEIEPGRFISHYELYHLAMLEMGVDAIPMRSFERAIRDGMEPAQAIGGLDIPEATKRFTLHTLAQAKLSTHEVAASFLVGREDIIPWMFRRLLMRLDSRDDPLMRMQIRLARERRRIPDRLWHRVPDRVKHWTRGLEELRRDKRRHFRLYLERHIGIDEQHHAPMGKRMLRMLCEDDDEKWADATEAARSALVVRCDLWDGIIQELYGDAPGTADRIRRRRSGGARRSGRRAAGRLERASDRFSGQP
jgi:hypothetical protein